MFQHRRRSGGRHSADHGHPLPNVLFPTSAKRSPTRSRAQVFPPVHLDPINFEALVSAAARESRTAAGGVAGSQLGPPVFGRPLALADFAPLRRARSARSFIPRRKRRCSTTHRRSRPSRCLFWDAKCRSKSSSPSKAGYKIRDATGTVAWMEKRRLPTGARSSSAHRQLMSLASPEANAAVVFKAEQNVLLELVDAVSCHQHARVGEGPTSRRPDRIRPHFASLGPLELRSRR